MHVVGNYINLILILNYKKLTKLDKNFQNLIIRY